MNLIPWLMWGATLIIGAVNCIVVCTKIEKTGLKRLGATGSLFKYMINEENK